MRGVIQSRTGRRGTCFRASLASILNLREDQVPDFQAANQDPGVDKFLSKYGLRYEEFPITPDNAPVGYHFILGVSPRGGEHAIVGKDGKPVWDPHPAGDGTGQGLVKPERYGVLIPIGAKDALLSGKRLNTAAEPLRIKHDEIQATREWANTSKARYYAAQALVQELLRETTQLIQRAKLDDDPVYWGTKAEAAHKTLAEAVQKARQQDWGRALILQDCALSMLHSVIDKMRHSGGRAKDAMKLTLDQWKSQVKAKYPKVKLTHGGGYGSSSDWTAHVGPDMQADVVGVFSKENGFYSIGRQEGKAKDADDNVVSVYRGKKIIKTR